MNQIATMVLAIEPHEVVLQRGGYDDYLLSREKDLEIKQAAAARQGREIQRQMRFVERFRSIFLDPIKGYTMYSGGIS